MAGRATIYNRIVTKQAYDSILPENKQLIADFVDYLKAVDRSPRTIEQYKGDLKIFFCYNAEHNGNKRFTEITKREFAKFQSHVLDNWKWSPNRTRRVKASISSLSNFIEKILDEEPEYAGYRSVIRKIESPALEPRREKTIVTDEEVQRVLDSLTEQGEFQCACMFALAAYSGSRRNELLRFKVSYFDDANIMETAALYRTPEKIQTKGRGSHGKALYKYTLLEFKPYLDAWMKERERLGLESEYIFINRKNGVLSESAVDKYSRKVADILGKPFYFHCLRHQLCTRLFRIGVPANIIQEFFGWSGLEMTNVYNDLEASDSFGKYFTKDGIKGV